MAIVPSIIVVNIFCTYNSVPSVRQQTSGHNYEVSDVTIVNKISKENCINIIDTPGFGDKTNYGTLYFDYISVSEVG